MSDNAEKGGGFKALQRIISAAFCHSDTLCFFGEINGQLVEYSTLNWGKKQFLDKALRENEHILYRDITDPRTIPDEVIDSGTWAIMALSTPSVKKEGSSPLIQILPSVPDDPNTSIYVQVAPSEKISNIANVWESAILTRQNTAFEEGSDWPEYFTDYSMKLCLFDSLQKTKPRKDDRNVRSLFPIFKLGADGYSGGKVRYNLSKMECLDPKAGHFLWGARALFEMFPAVYYQRLNYLHERDEEPGEVYLETIAFTGKDATARATKFMEEEQLRILTTRNRHATNCFQRTVCPERRVYAYQGREGVMGARTLPLTEDDMKFLYGCGAMTICSDIVMSNGTMPIPIEETLSGKARWILIREHTNDAIGKFTDGCWT